MNVRLLKWVIMRLASLPYGVTMRLGSLVGFLAYHFAKRRRHIALVNINKCFPELDKSAQEKLVLAQFKATGTGLIEAPIGWFGDEQKLMSLSKMSGREHLDAALAQGKGAIVLTFHYACMDMAGLQLSHEYPLAFMHRPHNDPELNELFTKGRLRFAKRAISRHNPRDMLKALKENLVVCYYPDHDLGRKSSEFAPFFGIPTAWVSAISRMAQISGAPVVPMLCERLPNGKGVHIRLQPALDNFPTDSVLDDLTRVSLLLESHLREHPENYLWSHRRFKTRPEGEPSFYQ